MNTHQTWLVVRAGTGHQVDFYMQEGTNNHALAIWIGIVLLCCCAEVYTKPHVIGAVWCCMFPTAYSPWAERHLPVTDVSTVCCGLIATPAGTEIRQVVKICYMSLGCRSTHPGYRFKCIHCRVAIYFGACSFRVQLLQSNEPKSSALATVAPDT